MDFEFSQREIELKDQVAALFSETALLEINSMEEADEAGLKRLTGRFLERLAETGYLEPALGPQAVSGLLGLMAPLEVLAEASGSLLMAVESSTRLFGGLVAGYGGPDLVRNLLDPLKKGALIGAVAVSEPGGDAPDSETGVRARLEGDSYRVTGRKSFVTNGPIADWIAVSGRVGEKPAFFLVNPVQEGLLIGPRLKTLGYNGLAVCELDLTEVKAPAGLVLGPFDDRAALDFLTLIQDLVLTMASIGLIRRVLKSVNTYSRAHHRSGKPIYSHQEVRFKLADMYTVWDTARLMTIRAAWLCGLGDREAGTVVECCKIFAAESAERTTAEAMQIMAGAGYLVGNVVERGYREAKYASLAGTTNEVGRMNIADDLLARYPV
ncbi:MAG: acyl-CoA dehydrogenase [Proteobacteria bacterium]|nr:acyl-CoA dehydrogenase [Pseudomonadota bacterium]